jgi:hypothetical protein
VTELTLIDLLGYGILFRGSDWNIWKLGHLLNDFEQMAKLHLLLAS